MPTAPASLHEPLSSEAPCGVDLEDTQLLASFDAFRVFGRDTPPSPEVDWSGIRQQSLDALAQSRDLRLLAYLAAATLRLEGIGAFCAILVVADHWLSERWELVFPRVADDALLRKNALSCFADPMAVVASLRRATLATHRQFGNVTLRDIDQTTGQPDSPETERGAPDPGRITAVLTATPAKELEALVAAITDGTQSLDNIAANMQRYGGPQATPDFVALAKPLLRMRKLLAEHVAARLGTNSKPPATPAQGVSAPTPDESMSGTPVSTGTENGEIRSRQDAIRAIDEVVLFFRRHEPSSPVPLLLERARRLISKGFLEVLQDIAPDGLAQARLIGGIRNDVE